MLSDCLRTLLGLLIVKQGNTSTVEAQGVGAGDVL